MTICALCWFVGLGVGGLVGGGGSEGVKLAPLKCRFLGCVCANTNGY